jgi:hypothetical protein
MQQQNSYQIRVQGHLDQRWSDWFDGLTMTHEPNGQTLFSGVIEDQAALHGTLNKIRDLGLPLISVQRLDLHDDGDAHSTLQ